MVTMLSGGAAGADYEWGLAATINGHEVIHFSFNGHDSKCDPSTIYKVSDRELTVADMWLKQAKIHLKRQFPSNSKFVNNLLRRNYYQVKETDAVYAIGTFNPATLTVNGGTAWATSMYCLIHDRPFYFFHQEYNKWYEKNISGLHKEIRIPPRPSDYNVWTGIGTREINLNGKLAIDYLFNG
jgi:hypothetical protein